MAADSPVPMGESAAQGRHTASAAHERMDGVPTAMETSVRATGTHLARPVSAVDALEEPTLSTASLSGQPFAAAAPRRQQV